MYSLINTVKKILKFILIYITFTLPIINIILIT